MHELDKDLRDALSVIMEPSSPGAEPHPLDDDLLAYREGRLPASRRDQLRRHLVDCHACQDRVLAISEQHPAASRPGTRSRSSHQGWLAAAGIAAIGFALWSFVLRETNGRLREQLERASEPTLEALPIALTSIAGRRSGTPNAGEIGTVLIAPGQEFFTLDLIPPMTIGETESCTLAVVDEDQEILWETLLALPIPPQIRLRVPTARISPGTSELRLACEDDLVDQPSGRFLFRVLAQPRDERTD